MDQWQALASETRPCGDGNRPRRYGYLLAMTLTVLAACGGGSDASLGPMPGTPIFVREGLDGRIVSHIYRRDDRLFATTDNGLYGKFIGRADWNLLGLGGFKVQDLVTFDDQHWLAAVFPTATPFVDPMLFETVNGGSNWHQVENDFGDGPGQTEGIFALLYDEAGGQLFATGTNALARSTDLGRSWQLLEGSWGSLSKLEALAFNRATGQVWIGGQNSIEEMILRRYDLATGQSTSYPRLLASPAVIKGITFDPGDPNRVLASGERGLLQSFNNGQSWTAPLGDVDSRFYFQTALDPDNSNVIFTAGWDKIFDEPQPLILEISRDRGVTWEAHRLNNPTLFGGALSIRAIKENARTVVYIGLYRGGIVKVSFAAG